MKKIGTIYMIGIKGVGMTMLAQFLATTGNKVIGSDVSETFLTDAVLKKSGIRVKTPFAVSNIPAKIDLVIYSSAFKAENNVELKYLETKKNKDKKVPIICYAQALGELFNSYKGVAVCGSHGKTTTTAWLAYVLSKAGKEPKALIGSRVPQLGGSALNGKSKLLVAEVDEYQNKLKYFQPVGVLLNNIDYDHPDFFKDEKAYNQVFIDFVKKIPASGFLIIDGYDKKSVAAAKHSRGQVISYGLAAKEMAWTKVTVNYQARNVRVRGAYQYFLLNNLGEFKIKLWGEHNIKNALAVIAAARKLGVSLANIKKYLAQFKGTARRGQVLGKYKGAIIIDDYAHHPTEIKATLEGISAYWPKKNIRVIFHPHTFTRTKALFSDFVTSFSRAHELTILDIYGSAREKKGGTSSQILVKAIKAENKKNKLEQRVENLKDIKAATYYLKQTAKAGEVIVLMGAGDVFRVADNLFIKK
ncbi:MAG: UDP-N-acetylmuramate--L-alanine ligase [Patescibacteria group bacterium]|nr:UDP-N-acetylmuramate--L-alanine ligase [Patescibacteria group bacterium]